ncbi:type II toxin-antitoxin system prevent-host-death family antitoxin [Deinococcus hohokamensis]|uniref:Antitoxin n=1 Tax=Deinococcus hohokamensis TaxID=309883 RepID=A0ABV9I9T2_9DEIO
MSTHRPPTWSYEDAQAQLSEVLDRAASGEPQRITQPDGSVIVVLATRTSQPAPTKPASDPS